MTSSSSSSANFPTSNHFDRQFIPAKPSTASSTLTPCKYVAFVAYSLPHRSRVLSSQIEYAVATNIVGPAIPQALRAARYELSEGLTGEVEERKDAFPETNEPARLNIREKVLVYEYSKKVSRLETIFTRR